MSFVRPVVEREIAQWVHPMKDRSDNPSHHERTLLPRSYISLRIWRLHLAQDTLIMWSARLSSEWDNKWILGQRERGPSHNYYSPMAITQLGLDQRPACLPSILMHITHSFWINLCHHWHKCVLDWVIAVIATFHLSQTCQVINQFVSSEVVYVCVLKWILSLWASIQYVC